MTMKARPATAGSHTQSPASRRFFGGVLFIVLAAVLILPTGVWAPEPAPASVSQERVLEDLKFKVDLMIWKDVARARLTLTSLGAGRYRAEISGEPLGMLKKLSGQRRDSYQTEMIYRQGRLVPLVYREESRKRGKRALKEYRFDYEQDRLELWQLKGNKGAMVRKWQTALKGQVHDPLSAFYNCRLGLLGPVQEGKTFTVTGIPYPKPEEIEVRIGPVTEAGRKTMISIPNRVFANDRGVVFAFLDDDQVPQQAWTTVMKVGKISGELLPGGKPLHGGLPGTAAGN